MAGFAFLHLLANQRGWYYDYPWIDIVAHLGGGVLVAWLAYAYRDRIRGYAALPRWAQAFGLVCFVALVGILWEFLELAADASRLRAWGATWADVPRLLDQPPFNLRWDTMKDLALDLLGGALTAAWAYLRPSRGTRS